MNILAIIIIAVLILSTLLGMKTGLIKTVFYTFSIIAALLLTIWISPLVSNLMKSNEKIVNYFNEKVTAVLSLEEKAIKISEQSAYMEELSLPNSFKKAMIDNNNSNIYEALNVSSFTEYIAKVVTNVIINAIAFIGTFIVIIILLQILCIALNIVSKLPVLNSINKAGGLVAGLLRGVLLVWLFFIFITAFGSTAWGKTSLKYINESQILSFIYNYNFIMKYITAKL